MNILPKKRWHVRTKENIARVRKDEAEAAEKERQEQQRIENADREARLNYLKKKSRLNHTEYNETVVSSEVTPPATHINLFADLEHAVQTTNKYHDEEVKAKKEEYEKKIGYLTYLGQDTNEALKKKNWYEILPDRTAFARSSDVRDTYNKLVFKDCDGKPKNTTLDEKNGEVSFNSKQREDPFNAFRKLSSEIKTNSKEKLQNCKETNVSKCKSASKNKEHNKKETKYEKQEKLLKLREARLKREQEERYKTQRFLTGQHISEKNAKNINEEPKVKPKYNSQFNPELARQNYRY